MSQPTQVMPPVVTPVAPAHPRRHRARRRGCCGPWALLVFVLVIVLGLLGLDRVGVVLAQEAAATKIQSIVNSPEKPTVIIRGFPFLTQAIDQKLDHVSITAKNPNIRGIQIDAIEADFYQLKANAKMNSASAEKVQGKVRASWEFVSSKSGVRVSYVGSNQVRVERTTTVFGQQVNVAALGTATLNRQNQTLVFNDLKLELLGVPLPAQMTQNLLGQFSRPVRLPIHDHLRATDLSTSAEGIAVSFEGNNIDLAMLKS